MAENTQLMRPSAGQSSVIPVGPDARLEFTFDQGDANLSKDGQNLVLAFDDGGVLTLEGFYNNFGDNAQPPMLVVEGNELPGEAFLAALNNPDLMPAAGPAAGALLGGGAYEDALLSGVDGVDRLEKLPFDGWGRTTEHEEHYVGIPAPEMPGGTFGLAGNSYDMNGMFVTSGMYEDWRPNQHTGDYDSVLLGRLDFNFTPTGTTVVDAIHLSGFDAGTTIVIGTPVFDAEGNITNGVTVTGPGQTFTFTQSNFDNAGVYVLPPKNSDHDMDIGVKLDLHAQSSGIRGTLEGSFTIIVDAVADKPEVQEAAFDFMHLVGAVDEAQETHKEFDDHGFHVIDQKMDGTEAVSVTVPFSTTVKFDDYEDGSESHYVLIEVPSMPPGAEWTCPEAVGTITGPDGKEYFQIPVNNADIATHDGEITVNVNLTVTGDSATVKDTDMTLQVGAMAEEHPDDGELTLENNIAFDFKEGGTELHLDVVDGGLKITAGWASEGNNDAKHLGTISDGYAYTGAEAGATANLADGATNIGAPITIEVGVNSQGQPEFITSVTFAYDASEGHIWQFDGTQWVDLDPSGSGAVTLDGLSSSRLDGVVYRPSEGSFSDADVDVGYKVNVQNEAGVKGSYSGSFTVVVDAVADLSTEVISAAAGDHDNQYYVDKATETINDTTAHGKDGWEVDTFKLDYAKVEYGFTVHVETSFPDTSGTERHYVLVEHQAGWNLGGLPEGYTYAGEYTGADGKSYFKIEVDDRTQGEASLDVPLSRMGFADDVTVNLKTGSYVVETVGTGDELPDSGREYDLGNNIAQRTDGTVAELRADVLNSTLTVKTGWASEGNNDAKHLGTTSDGYKYTGVEAGSTGNLADGKTNTGAPITFSLADGQGAGEFVSEVTFTFDGERGTLTYSGPGALSGPVENADGTVSYTLSGVHSANVDGVRFVPATEGVQSYNDADVAMKYDVTVSNGVSSHTFSGTSTVIIDAVADRPTELQIPGTDGTELSYTHVDAEGNTVTHDAATWGSEVGFTVGVTFHDIADGSETHYMLVEAKPGWSGDYNTVTIDGTTFFVIDVNDAVSAALKDGGYDQGGIRVEITTDAWGVPHASVTVDVNLTLPDKPADGSVPKYMEGDGQVGLASGGLAIEGEIKWDGKPDANGHDTGKIQVSGTDMEYDLGNNIALTLEPVMVNVNVVTSLPTVSIMDNAIYENLTANAHVGDETHSAGAKITVGGLHESESAEITFTFDFVKGGAQEGTFDSAPGHQDDVMRLEFTDSEGVVHAYPITWDGNAWTCTVTVQGGDAADLIFKPGYNYNSEDLAIRYEMTVTDPASGDQISWQAGDSPDLPAQLGVLVDAVAQQPIIDEGTQASYDRTGGTDAFVSGGKVDLEVKIEYRDFEDGSERHYVLVEAKVGWEAPSNTLTILDGNGWAHEVAVTWVQQMINGKMYYKAEVDNEYIQNWGTQGEHGEGMLDMHIAMQSPSGVAAHMDFKVGGGSWEDAGYVDGEIRWDNNTAFDFVTVGLDFNKVGDFALQTDGWVYENDTANAHLGDNTASGGTNLTVTVSHPGDVITDFHFTNYNPEAGTLYFNLPDGTRVEVDADGFIPGNPELHGGEQFTFIPAHNYSDVDVKLSYGGTITDPHSGDSRNPGHSSGIVVDAVAQKPEDVEFAQNGQQLPIDWHQGEEGGKGSFSLDVSAKFEDIADGSESHYVLVEALPNMSVPGSEGTFSVRDPESGKYITYWKVPVNNADIDENGNVTVQVTVVIEGVISGHGIHEDVRVGALAVENPSDGEITFHNNWAFTEGGKATVDWGPGGGSGPGFWAGDAYENDRPNSHLGDETPAGGAYVTFGQGDGDTVHVTWTGAEGYFRDEAGNEYRGGDVVLNGADGPFRFVPEGHGDEDVKLTYTVTHADGTGYSGTGTIVVDAVANKPDGLDANALVDYGNDGHGYEYTAVGKPDNHGNDGSVTVHISGNFVDNDGSEKHYALVEAQPGFNVPGGTMIYLEGKAYYQVEMAKDASGYLLDDNGKQYADVVVQVANPTAIGKAGHDLATGIMAEETNYGTADNLEVRTDNNVSWTLGGNAHIDVSFVDSSASVSVPNDVMERSEGEPGFPVTLSAHLGEDDVFNGMTITANGAGEFSIVAPEGVGGWEIVGNTLVITDFDAIGKIQVTFTPATHSDQDISFNWSAKFTDERSGDVEARSGSPYVIVDAVANAPTIEGTHIESDGGALAAYAGEGTNITTTLNFEDTSGREVHYAVLQQGQFIGKADNVWLADGVLINGQPAEIVTVFDQSQKPYYAAVIPNDALDADGNVDITWHVTAPNISQDVDAKLLMGGISVEPGTGTEPGHKELTLDNNWAETVQPMTVKIAAFDTTEVRFGADGQLVENDTDGVAIHLQAPAAGTNEIITQTEFTFTQNGAKEGDVIGTVWYNDEAHEIVADESGVGHLTLTFGDQGGEGYDPAADFRFTATDADGNSFHNSNPVTIGTESTVKDVYLGEERTFSDSQVVNVQAVADAPTDVAGTSPADAAGAGQEITVTVAASFVDVDGSEKHYMLVEAREGWACGESKGTYTDTNTGKSYFMVEVDGSLEDVTKDISLTTPKNYVLGDHQVELAVGGLAVEQVPGSDNTHGFTPGGIVTVDIHDTASLTLVSNNGNGVAEGGELSFTLTLANDVGQQFIAGEAMSVTLRLTGVDEAPEGWVPATDGLGGCICTVFLPADSSTANITIPAPAPDGVIGSTTVPNMQVEVIASSIPSDLAGNVEQGGGFFNVPILDVDHGHLVLNATALDTGEMAFVLSLQKTADDNSPTTAAEPITATFILDNVGHDMPVPEDWLGTRVVMEGFDSTVTWQHNMDNTYTLTVTLAEGESSVNIGQFVHAFTGDGVINPNEPLSLTLDSVTSTPGLDANISITGDVEGTVAPGASVSFTITDSEWQAAHDAGLDANALTGAVLHQIDGVYEHDAAVANESGDHVVLGTGGDDHIYASQGSDVMVGGGGHDTFIWNNHNMGQDESARDVITDFQKGDSLRFDDFFSGSSMSNDAVGEALNTLISNGQWTASPENGHDGTFSAESDYGSIHLSVANTVATLTVSYEHAGEQYTQNVELQNFNVSGFQNQDGGLDHAAVQEMLHEIIKVGGNI